GFDTVDDAPRRLLFDVQRQQRRPWVNALRAQGIGVAGRVVPAHRLSRLPGPALVARAVAAADRALGVVIDRELRRSGHWLLLQRRRRTGDAAGCGRTGINRAGRCPPGGSCRAGAARRARAARPWTAPRAGRWPCPTPAPR